MVGDQDKVFTSPLEDMVDFRFDERVVDVFPDMIQRSVPGYATLINQIGVMAATHVIEDSHCYDLGCSLGAVSLSLQNAIQSTACKIIAIDNSAAMINKARQIINNDDNPLSSTHIQLQCADINEVAIENASVVVMNFTLQFIPLEQRSALIQRIYEGLLPGGIFILSEKLRFLDDSVNQFLINAHHNFKRANGYSDLEISRKRSALENVLIPETLEQHHARLKHAGFSMVEKWYQCFNFASLVAIK